MVEQHIEIQRVTAVNTAQQRKVGISKAKAQGVAVIFKNRPVEGVDE